VFLLGAVLLCVAQALLTLSRTGIWLAAISCVFAGVQLAKSPRQSFGIVLSAVTVGLFWLAACLSGSRDYPAARYQGASRKPAALVARTSLKPTCIFGPVIRARVDVGNVPR